MFDPVTIDAQVDRLGRVAAPMDMIAVKRGHAAATGTALDGRPRALASQLPHTKAPPRAMSAEG
jgi:hypothetical protein